MALLQLRGKALIFMILITSGLDFLLFGYDQGTSFSHYYNARAHAHTQNTQHLPVNNNY